MDVIAVANSGWFTMPDRDIDYPYGIKNVGITDEELGKRLQSRSFSSWVKRMWSGNRRSAIRPKRTPRG